MRECAFCGGNMSRAIYYGLPHWLCDDRTCGGVSGLAANITAFLPFNGRFMLYKQSYWKALIIWLFFQDKVPGE